MKNKKPVSNKLCNSFISSLTFTVNSLSMCVERESAITFAVFVRSSLLIIDATRTISSGDDTDIGILIPNSFDSADVPSFHKKGKQNEESFLIY